MKVICKIIWTILLFFLICSLTFTVGANEVIIEQEGDFYYLTYIPSNVNAVSGYNIQITYLKGEFIDEFEALEPYIGVSYIDNENSLAQIIGFTGGYEYNSRLAYFTYSGSGEFKILIYELIDENLNDILVSNEVITIPDVIEPTPAVAQPYSNKPNFPFDQITYMQPTQVPPYQILQKTLVPTPAPTPVPHALPPNQELVEMYESKETYESDSVSYEQKTVIKSNEGNTNEVPPQAPTTLAFLPGIFLIPSIRKRMVSLILDFKTYMGV